MDDQHETNILPLSLVGYKAFYLHFLFVYQYTTLRKDFHQKDTNLHYTDRKYWDRQLQQTVQTQISVYTACRLLRKFLDNLFRLVKILGQVF